MTRQTVRTEAEKQAFFVSELAAELGAIHQRCCREVLEYPGACERTSVSAGTLGIRVQQSIPEWAAFQNATHFWADWDAAHAEVWAPYKRVLRVLALIGPGPRADSRSQQLLWRCQEYVYRAVLPHRVWREAENHALQQLAEKLHRRR